MRPICHPPPGRPGDLPARLREARLLQREGIQQQRELQGLRRPAG